MLQPDECPNDDDVAKLRPHRETVTILGRIDSLAYQRAKYYIELFARHLPDKFKTPEIHGYWETDWLQIKTKYQRLYGGPYWEIIRPVICYVDDVLIGDDNAIIRHLVNGYQISVVPDFLKVGAKDLRQRLRHDARCHIYFCVTIDDIFAGILVFQLYNDLVPKTCANFLRLVMKRRKGFKCAIIHRICLESWIQIGGWRLSRGDAHMNCENYMVAHDRRGILSMCNDGRNRNNTTQCLVTLNPTPWMDGKYVAFGRLIIGDETLTKIAAVNTYYEYPTVKVLITECGLYSFTAIQAGRDQEYLVCLLREAKKDIRGPHGDYVRNIRLPADIRHPKDLSSDFQLRRYVQGWYSFEMDRGSMAWRFPVHSAYSLQLIKEHTKWWEDAELDDKRLKRFPPDVVDERDCISTTSKEEFKLLFDMCDVIADNQREMEEIEQETCPYLTLGVK